MYLPPPPPFAPERRQITNTDETAVVTTHSINKIRNNIEHMPTYYDLLQERTYPLKYKTSDFKYRKLFYNNQSLLYNQNPYLIHYETCNITVDGITYPYDYPIITLPKGTVLYTYSKPSAEEYKNFIYNLHQPNDTKNSLKFFYPVPYAAHGIPEYGYQYTHCNIVYLTEDTRVVALVLPSPVTRAHLRTPNAVPVTHHSSGMNYYDNGLTGTCSRHDYDLCLYDFLSEQLNLQGYISIAEMDSISCSPGWANLLTSGRLNPHIINQFIYKSNVLPYACEGQRNSSAVLNRVYGIPEIVLNPIKIAKLKQIQSITEVVNAVNESPSALKHAEDKWLSYNLITMVPKTAVKETLESLTEHFLENTQNPIFQLYRPKMNPAYPYVRNITYYTELTRENVDFIYTYNNAPYTTLEPNRFCAFDTVLNYILQGGSTPRRYNFVGGKKRRKTLHKTRSRSRSQSSSRKRKGGTTTTLLQSQPLTLMVAPQHTTQKTMPLPTLKITKNNIPILYW